MKEQTNNLPKVVLFGRTNVGKSTLFNTLTEKHSALVSDIHGTTRDVNTGTVEWNRCQFEIIDTGGIIEISNLFKNKKKKIKQINSLADLDTKVQQLAENYLEQADLILYLVNSHDGILPQDQNIAKEIQKRNELKDKTLLVANKTDNFNLRNEASAFNKLGLGKPYLISASTGSGTGDLLDLIVKKLKTHNTQHATHNTQHITHNKEEEILNQESNMINVCIVGKPNVGKSSLVNSILGEEKIIVSPIAHTTREPNDTKISYKDKEINLIDTAGISKQGQKNTKKSKTKNTLASHSIDRTLKILNKADIALLILDVEDGLTHQDSKIVEEIITRNIGLIIVGNKWDLIEDHDTKSAKQEIYGHLPFATWAPIQFVSALTGEKVKKIFDIILKIDEKRKTKINQNYLTRFLKKLIKQHKPTKAGGTKYPYIYELKQTRTNPPAFQIRIGSKDSLSDSYVRFIQNKLRKEFDFFGTPVSVSVTKNKKIHGMSEEDSWDVLEKNKEKMKNRKNK
ncbi:ribosome biogenesis GTPase Der [Candidatus Parcubacteria bacterium]|nr:ribosome biogenesis GTPase Der [Candidatus Parcubacteria bacterium]